MEKNWQVSQNLHLKHWVHFLPSRKPPLKSQIKIRTENWRTRTEIVIMEAQYFLIYSRVCTCRANQGSAESQRGQLPTEGLQHRLIIWTWVHFLQTRWVLEGGLTNTCEIITCLTLIPSFRNTSFSLWKPCSKLSLREEFLDLNPTCVYEKIYSEFQNATLRTTSPVSSSFLHLLEIQLCGFCDSSQNVWGGGSRGGRSRVR